MQRSQLLTPISILLAGCILIALLVFQPILGSQAAPPRQELSYPEITQTIIALTQSYIPPGGSTNTPTVTGTATATGTATTTGVATAAPTITANPTINPGQAFPTETLAPEDQDGPSGATITPLIATPTNGARACVPGETVHVSGYGPSNAGFLVYFDDRVVSGGTIRRDGTFDMGLMVGNEQAGAYQVEIRVRGTRQVLLEFQCQVPPTTPTPRIPAP